MSPVTNKHRLWRARATPEVDELRRTGIRLCAAVRAWDKDDVAHALTETDNLRGLCVVLAAMVPEGKTATTLLSWVPEDTPQSGQGHDTTALAGRALVLVAAVHDWDYSKILAAIGATDPTGLCVVLAAMVPDTIPVDTLLAWTHARGDHRFTATLNTEAA